MFIVVVVGFVVKIGWCVDVGFLEVFGECEGVVVEIEDECGEDGVGDGIEVEVCGLEYWCGCVSGVEFVVDDFFLDGGLIYFVVEFDFDVVFCEEFVFLCDDEGCGIG